MTSQPYDLQTAAPYEVWGRDQIDPPALEQMDRAVRLPVALRGALMPDAHVGYGLPIGGVLATVNAVIPYAVGVDIACRVRMTIFNATPRVIDEQREKLRRAIEDNTRFGEGGTWETRQEHEVMEDRAWQALPFARQRKDHAWSQLGTSGGGNHFVEFGALTVWQPVGRIPPGSYLALLSHSGSRRFGFEAANHYTQVARDLHAARLPKDFLHLAWLEMGKEGDEYWQVMELAGRYASANHAIIHRRIVSALRYDVLGSVENHHNFAWQEPVDGIQAIVHRKGATPAGRDILGVIPGSMSAPGYIVKGKGSAAGLNSAAHGAGRRMSRGEAFRRFDWEVVDRQLQRDQIDLLSAGLDEVPGAYKDIHRVMEAQADLVEPLAEFQPRIVKMAPPRGKQRSGDGRHSSSERRGAEKKRSKGGKRRR